LSQPGGGCIFTSSKKTSQEKEKQVMKKIVLVSIAIISLSFAAKAQTNTATQTVQLSLTNALEIIFTGSGTATGTTVAIPFTNVNDMANGVESAAQQLKVRSNKNFNVTVKTSATTFTSTINGVTSVSTMPAAVLDVKVASNQTGGTIAGTYSNYTDLSTTANNVITNGAAGGNQTFSVQYKATPGFSYSAGTYSVDVVYTATQQ
jgi:hypothetical protein